MGNAKAIINGDQGGGELVNKQTIFLIWDMLPQTSLFHRADGHVHT